MIDPRLTSAVNELQKDLASLVALVTPGVPFLPYSPAVPVKPRFAFSLGTLEVLWRVGMTIAVLLVSLLHLKPTPVPAPIPAPVVPSPPSPAPSPPSPAPSPHVTARLYAIQVFNPASTDASTLAAVSLGADPATEEGLLPLDVQWRHWDVGEPMLDSLKLRAFLPDPARLPALLVYDATGQFYDLSGAKLPRSGPVFQTPPRTVSALVAAFKQIRSH